MRGKEVRWRDRNKKIRISFKERWFKNCRRENRKDNWENDNDGK